MVAMVNFILCVFYHNKEHIKKKAFICQLTIMQVISSLPRIQQDCMKVSAGLSSHMEAHTGSWLSSASQLFVGLTSLFPAACQLGATLSSQLPLTSLPSGPIYPQASNSRLDPLCFESLFFPVSDLQTRLKRAHVIRSGNYGLCHKTLSNHRIYHKDYTGQGHKGESLEFHLPHQGRNRLEDAAFRLGERKG